MSMRILVVTSCTGEKVVESPDQLTLDDFRRGATHVAEKETALKPLLRSAEDLYSGLQHIRLMKGLRAAREAGRLDVELQVLSAGYGLVFGGAMPAPYEATFAGMKGPELREWARTLRVPQAIGKLLGQPRDVEGDGLVGEHAGHQDRLALEDPHGHVPSLVCVPSATFSSPCPGRRPPG